MKMVVVLVAVSLVLGVASPCLAADLQAGWYAKIGGVVLYGVDPSSHAYRGVAWNFSGGTGSFPPFDVAGFDTRVPQRAVSVPQNSPDITAGTSVYLWGDPQTPVSWPITAVDVYWDTVYQPGVMRLELLKYNPNSGYTLLWAQSESGHSVHWENVLIPGTIIEADMVPVFRVTVVPEPSSIGCLALFATAALGARRRRP